MTILVWAQQRPNQMSWIEKGVAKLKLLGDKSEGDRPVVRLILFWRRQPSVAPSAQSTRSPNLGVVVQRDSDQDID